MHIFEGNIPNISQNMDSTRREAPACLSLTSIPYLMFLSITTGNVLIPFMLQKHLFVHMLYVQEALTEQPSFGECQKWHRKSTCCYSWTPLLLDCIKLHLLVLACLYTCGLCAPTWLVASTWTASTIICLGLAWRPHTVTCAADDYLASVACLAWLALWPSWC